MPQLAAAQIRDGETFLSTAYLSSVADRQLRIFVKHMNLVPFTASVHSVSSFYLILPACGPPSSSHCTADTGSSLHHRFPPDPLPGNRPRLLCRPPAKSSGRMPKSTVFHNIHLQRFHRFSRVNWRYRYLANLAWGFPAFLYDPWLPRNSFAGAGKIRQTKTGLLVRCTTHQQSLSQTTE